MKYFPGSNSFLRVLRQEFQSDLGGNGLVVLGERTSATETGESSVQRRKLTKIRPEAG